MDPFRNPLIPLSQLGQRFRERGRALDMNRLRRAIEAGEVPAERRGCRWQMTETDAEPYSRPLPGRRSG